MDYEKKYKEALERVRRLHDRMQFLSSTDALVASSELEFIFPELAESDDERIRMELVAFFKGMQDSDWHEKYWHDLEIDRILAYLEKQKEQKKKNALIWGEPQVTITVQKPAEWSEEDKEKIVTISEIIEHCTTIPYSGGKLTLNKEYKKELLCFIRTLRPSWKPSEVQMDALEAATVRYQSTGLESLYEELKKL